jgi:FdhD protein
MTGHPPILSLPGLSVRAGRTAEAHRALAEEVPVALVYNGTTQAVMMATPEALEDFALGFSVTEGIVEDAGQIESLEIVEHGAGFEARMWLAEPRAAALAARRRAMTGPVGCGLCGIDSLAEALRPVPPVADTPLALPAEEVGAAMAALRAAQVLHDRTHAAHAAGFWVPGAGLLALREDVGRHNALDKLAGALLGAGIDPASGAALLTSRVSVDLVQKCATLGVPVLIAVSAPTAHAVRLAAEAGSPLSPTRGATGSRSSRAPIASSRGPPPMSREKLVHMANQIATFFRSQPGTDQADRVAQHLRDYWDPRMRAQIVEIAEDPESGLSPLAREAVARLGMPAGGA